MLLIGADINDLVTIQLHSNHRVGGPMTRVSVAMDGDSQAAMDGEKRPLA